MKREKIDVTTDMPEHRHRSRKPLQIIAGAAGAAAVAGTAVALAGGMFTAGTHNGPPKAEPTTDMQTALSLRGTADAAAGSIWDMASHQPAEQQQWHNNELDIQLPNGGPNIKVVVDTTTDDLELRASGKFAGEPTSLYAAYHMSSLAAKESRSDLQASIADSSLMAFSVTHGQDNETIFTNPTGTEYSVYNSGSATENAEQLEESRQQGNLGEAQSASPDQAKLINQMTEASSDALRESAGLSPI